MKSSIFFIKIILFTLFFYSSIYAQSIDEFKKPETILNSKNINYSLQIDEQTKTINIISPYHIVGNVIDLDKSNQELLINNITNISKSLSFWIAQSEAIIAIEKQYPDLIPKCIKATEKFNKTFGPSIIQIFYSFENNLNKKIKFKQFRDLSINETKKIINSNPELKKNYPWLFNLKINRNEAENFITLIENRANFINDIEFTKPLLMFHPEAISNPLGLLTEQYLLKYDFDNNPKAKSLKGWIRFPAHWEVQEANAPNIIKKFVSPRDGATFMLQTIQLPEKIGSIKNIDLWLKDTQFLNEITKGYGNIIATREVQIYGKNSIEVLTHLCKETPLVKAYLNCVFYIIINKNTIIFVIGTIGDTNKSTCQKNMESYLPTFRFLASMIGFK